MPHSQQHNNADLGKDFSSFMNYVGLEKSSFFNFGGETLELMACCGLRFAHC